MSREHDYAAFRKWADEKLEEVRRRECLFCGYPTSHPSQTCPEHRDLAAPIFELEIDAALEQGVSSPDGGETSGVGGADLATDVASGAPPDSRRVDRGST